MAAGPDSCHNFVLLSLRPRTISTKGLKTTTKNTAQIVDTACRPEASRCTSSTDDGCLDNPYLASWGGRSPWWGCCGQNGVVGRYVAADAIRSWFWDHAYYNDKRRRRSSCGHDLIISQCSRELSVSSWKWSQWSW